MENKGIVFVVSGPSGAGKGTICNKLKEENESIFLSVSATTRQKREGETEGVNYYYYSKEQFLSMAENGEFIEYAEYCGNYYGTPKKYVNEAIDQGRDVILEIDVQGGAKIRETIPNGVYIFVVPPSYENLRERLIGRGTEDEQKIKSRLCRAKDEFAYIGDYDYILVNDDLDDAVKSFYTILKTERMKVKRSWDFIRTFTGAAES